MANTSGRTLRLLSLLQNHRYWPGTELAGRLGVSPRTLRRDIERLRDLGYPVRAHPGVDGGYQLAAGANLPPLVIDDDEAVAVAVALHAAAASGSDSVPGSGSGTEDTVGEASVRALAKLTQVMPARLRRHVTALTSMTVPATWGRRPGGQGVAPVAPGTLTVIALACRDTERVRFGYTAASGDQTDRYVEPHRLVSLAGRWYLVAYDLTRQDWRNFRLDRIAGQPRGTGERFAVRALPAADAAEFVRQSIGSARGRYEAEALVEAPEDEIKAALGHWASVEPVADGQCRVRVTSDNLDWPLMLLGLAGAGFRIESPPELADRARDWARRFASAAGP